VPERDTRPPVIVVTGPTATGKSALAIQLAERFAGEIVNADSMQVYRYLDIGTAKPSLAERARVPHHLFDVVTPDVEYNAGRYCSEARAAAAAIHGGGAPVLLVGGTGLYIRAFLQGLVEEGGAADPELRTRLEAEHAQAAGEGDATRLHRRLAKADPESAARIHPNDVRRLVRALEILERTGEPPSQVRGRQGFADAPYRVLHLALDLPVAELDARIDERCRRMLDRGLLQEVRGLLERGYGPKLRPLQAIGYRHMWPVVEGSDTLANALPEMQRDTRRFARRQRTWLRSVPDARWMDPRDEAKIAADVAAFLESAG
jgi:tRNA dimethylallyltransferase